MLQYNTLIVVRGVTSPFYLGNAGLEMEAEVLTMRSDLDAAPSPAPILHPNLAELYRRQVKNLHEALNAQDSRTEAAEILRGIIERINVTPLGRGSFEIDLTGDIVNMIEFAESGTQTEKTASKEAAIPDVYRSSVKVVAGVGFEPTTFRL